MTGLADQWLDAEGALRDEIRRIDALRPPCPTCGGTKLVDKGEPNSIGLSWQQPCPDCTDGKVPIERLVKVFEGVHDFTGDLFTEEGAKLLYYLRSIK